MFLLPEIYLDAEWRTVTRFCAQRSKVGVAFTLANGQVVRLAIDADDAQAIADCINGCDTNLPARMGELQTSADPIHNGQSHT